MGAKAPGHPDGQEARQGGLWRRVGGGLEGAGQGCGEDLSLHRCPRQGEVPAGGRDIEAVRPSQHCEADWRFLGYRASADSDGADAWRVTAGLPEEEDCSIVQG